MDIVRENQVVALVTTHSASHAFFYPGLEIAAGLPADLSIRDLSVAMASATNNGTRTSATPRTTTRQR